MKLSRNNREPLLTNCIYSWLCSTIGLTELDFGSYTDFEIWKDNEEETTNTYYVLCRGKRAFTKNEI